MRIKRALLGLPGTRNNQSPETTGTYSVSMYYRILRSFLLQICVHVSILMVASLLQASWRAKASAKATPFFDAFAREVHIQGEK